MRIILSLDNSLSNRETCPSLVLLCMTISYVSISGISPLFFQIPGMDVILMGYWIAGQVGTMMSGVMYNNKLKIGWLILSRVLMMLCAVLFRFHLRNSTRIFSFSQ